MKLTEAKTLFNALADETRLRILNLLGEGELCVCDMMTVLGEPQSKISRHLAYLRRTRLVETTRKGLWMHYRLSAAGTGLLRAVSGALAHRGAPGELKSDLDSFRKKRGCLVACCR